MANYLNKSKAANNSEIVRNGGSVKSVVSILRKKKRKKFDLYKVNYSLMINITTESNQSFTTEFEMETRERERDFFLC